MKKYISLIVIFSLSAQNIEAAYHLLHTIHHISAEYRIHKRMFNDDIFQFISKHYGSLKIDHTEDRKKEQQEHHKNHKNCIKHIHFDQYYLKKHTLLFFTTIHRTKKEIFYLNNYESLYQQSLADPPDFF